jgi:thiosulfate/3-mercaptopyruvate sulfurtransferase
MRLEQLQQRLGDRALTILDSREPREYQGATPYGESRGGCVPGAIALYYRQLLREDGFLKPEAEIRQILADKGVQGEEVVAYCTGGVRSAWLVAVLQSLDAPRFRGVYNYPGSMWEWSSRPASDCPLVIPRESG